jgi:hypothetical protein
VWVCVGCGVSKVCWVSIQHLSVVGQQALLPKGCRHLQEGLCLRRGKCRV